MGGMARDHVLAVDLGGTNLRVAAVARDGSITCRMSVSTDAKAGPEVVAEHIGALLTEVAAEVELPATAAAGVAVPGPIDPRTGIVAFTPNLAGWRNFPLGDRLLALTGRPIALGNDGNCAALGEFRFGVGTESSNLLYLALGTGVGAGVISEGRLIEGTGGLAGELGHVVVSLDGPRCTCGSIGCLETFASGWAIARDANLVAATAEGAGIRRAAAGKRLNASVVADAARDGDAAAIEILARVGRALGAAIGSFINIFNPEMVVIGGGLASLGDLLMEPTRRAIVNHSFYAQRTRAKLAMSILGDDTALCGAAALAMDHQRLMRPIDAVST